MSTRPNRLKSVEAATPGATPEERLAAAEKALEEALAERNRLWAQLNEQRADQRELEHLRNEVSTIHSSRMWTIAGRYQRLRHVLRVGLRRLRQG